MENTENEYRIKSAEIIIQGLDNKTYTVFCKILSCHPPYFTFFQRNFKIADLLHILSCLYYFLSIFVEFQLGEKNKNKNILKSYNSLNY